MLILRRYSYTTKATAGGLTVGNVDLMTDHGYPRNLGLLNAQIPLAKNANKGFFIGGGSLHKFARLIYIANSRLSRIRLA